MEKTDTELSTCIGLVAYWFRRPGTPNGVVWLQELFRVTTLCSSARHLTFPLPPPTFIKVWRQAMIDWHPFFESLYAGETRGLALTK